jgi:hypothetical protein
MLHAETLEPGTFLLLKRIQALPFMADTRLVGGTALALLLGHRKSVDLDIFGSWEPKDQLQRELESCGALQKVGGKSALQFFMIDGVKIDCVTYSQYPWLFPPIEEDGVRLASLQDIAAMKVNAITNRGTRKDFVDLFFLLQHFSISEILDWFSQKYPNTALFMAMRSLVYFADAEETPVPEMLAPFNWDDAVATIREKVTAFAGKV